MTKSQSSSLPSKESLGLGEWQDSCGPDVRWKISHFVFLLLPLVGFVACLFAPQFLFEITPPKTPKDAQGMKILFYCLSGVFALSFVAALVGVLYMAFNRQAIHLFEGGIAEQRGQKFTAIIPWGDISALKLFEWYEHRFADATINVVVSRRGNRGELKFNSELGGNAERIIKAMQERVPNAQFIPFSA